MKVEGHPIHPPHPQPPAEPPRGRADRTGSSELKAPEPSVVLDLQSEPVGEPVAEGKTLTSLGKNAASPAHQAREMMAAYQELGSNLSDVKFGQVVSRIARGIDPSEILAPPPADPEPADEGGDETPAIVPPDDGEAEATSQPAAPASTDVRPDEPSDPDPDLAAALVDGLDDAPSSDSDLDELLLESLQEATEDAPEDTT